MLKMIYHIIFIEPVIYLTYYFSIYNLDLFNNNYYIHLSFKNYISFYIINNFSFSTKKFSEDINIYLSFYIKFSCSTYPSKYFKHILSYV